MPSPGHPVGANSDSRRRCLCALLLLLPLGVPAAPPAVSRTAEQIKVVNAHFSVVVDPRQGGAIAAIRAADGTAVTGGHALYTDWGLYADRAYFGTGHAPAGVTVETVGARVMVAAEGVLCDASGNAPTDPGAIAYRLRYEIGAEPEIRVSWAATPNFSKAGVQSFFSYILPVSGCIGVFANTEEGVLQQDPADHSTRTYQSAELPLNPATPWLGVMRADGRVLAFTDLRATPGFGNVFFHEDGKGGAGVFFAWQSGGPPRDLKAGEEWTGSFTLRLLPSFEALCGTD